MKSSRDKVMRRLRLENGRLTSALKLMQQDYNRKVAENAELRHRIRGAARLLEIK